MCVLKKLCERFVRELLAKIMSENATSESQTHGKICHGPRYCTTSVSKLEKYFHRNQQNANCDWTDKDSRQTNLKVQHCLCRFCPVRHTLPNKYSHRSVLPERVKYKSFQYKSSPHAFLHSQTHRSCYIQRHTSNSCYCQCRQRCRKSHQHLYSLLKVLVLAMCIVPGLAVEFGVGVVVAGDCEEAFVYNINRTVINATETLSSRGVASRVIFTFNLFPYCSQQQAASNISEIFQQSRDNAVIGLAPFELQTTFAALASLYSKPYISSNTFTPTIKNNYALSLYASFEQMSDVLKEILTEFKWQNVKMLVADQPYWQAFAKEAYVQLFSGGFRVSAKIVLNSPMTVTDASAALQREPPVSKGNNQLVLGVSFP